MNNRPEMNEVQVVIANLYKRPQAAETKSQKQRDTIETYRKKCLWNENIMDMMRADYRTLHRKFVRTEREKKSSNNELGSPCRPCSKGNCDRSSSNPSGPGRDASESPDSRHVRTYYRN
jgi:hypothetical protein